MTDLKECRCCASKINKKVEKKINHDKHHHDHNHDHSHGGHSHSHDDLPKVRNNIIISGISLLVLLLGDYFYNISDISRYLYVALYLYCGFSVLKEAFESIKSKDFFNEFTLMSLATIGAVLIKEYPEAVGVMLFYKVGEYLQQKIALKSRASIKDLMLSKPEKGNIIKGEEVIKVSVEEIKIGDLLLVKAGEKIPTDGEVVNGETTLDTSSITGEFMPVSVLIGNEVLGGMINLSNVITIRATKEYENTSIARVMELVEDSVKNKAPTERFISVFAKYYTPIVFFLALLVAILPPLFFGELWSKWIYRSLVLLVISCPCALLLSVPLSYFASIGFASKGGILVKGGVVMDAAKSITMVVFDKTGTLTEGKLVIKKKFAVNGNEEELLFIARYVEQFSNHPIAKAILGDFEIKHDDKAIVEDVSGKGLVVTSGKDIFLAGNNRLMSDNNISVEKIKETGTIVYVAKNNELKGYIVLGDEIKQSAKSVVEYLKKKNIKVMMLTGDNEASAEEVAKELGIDNFKSGLLPEQKLEEVNKYKDIENIMFVGDGTNDAPVLANAKLGVSMGGAGSKLAVEVSDVVIVNDDISKVSKLLDLSSKTKKVVWQNIFFCIGVKVLFIGLGSIGISGLLEAVFADVGVSVLAVLNAIRLIR